MKRKELRRHPSGEEAPPPVPSPTDEADLLNQEGVRLQSQGRFNEAREAFARACSLYGDVGNREGLARCLNGVGATSKDLEEFTEARSYLEAALAIRREVGDRRGEAITLLTLGPVYQILGLPEPAKEVLAIALQLTGEVEDLSLQGQVCYNLGSIHNFAGDFGESLQWTGRALAIAEELGETIEVAKCLNALGQDYSSLGQFDEAMKYLEACVTLARRLQRPTSEAIALESIANLYGRLGQPDVQRSYLEQGLKILLEANAIPLIAHLASLYGNLLLEEYHDAANAERFLDLALKNARRAGNLRLSAYVLQYVGGLHRKMSRPVQAAPVFEESIRLFKQSGDTYGEAGALQGLCAVELELGRHESALRHAEEALNRVESTGDEWAQATSLYCLAVCHDTQGKIQTALGLFERSITLFDKLRYRVSGDQLRTSFFDARTVQQAYYAHIHLLLRSRSTSNIAAAEEAFLVSERRHARALLDWIGESDAQEGRPANMYQPHRLSLKDFQEHLLDADTLLLEYSLHQGISYLFAVQQHAFEVHTLPSGDEIAAKAMEVRRLGASGTASEFAQASARLYEILLGPVAKLLPGKNLLIVPDAELHYLPFAMLVMRPPTASAEAPNIGGGEAVEADDTRGFWSNWTGKRTAKWSMLPFLVRQNAIAYAPSATVMQVLATSRRRLKSVTPTLDFIGIAPFASSARVIHGQELPKLPRTRSEVEKIAALFPPDRTLLRFDEGATKPSAVSGDLARCRYVHFATHGLVNSFEPQLSALVLRGPDNECLLSAAEIMNLKLSADIAVLSACETGLGKLRYGEGVIGLARAFLYAGAQSVCATLWEVVDSAAAELMCDYYRNLVECGRGNMEALRASQLALLNSENHSAPYNWAPFILVGG